MTLKAVRSATVLLAVVLGFVALFTGFTGVIQWHALPASTLLYYLVSLAGGGALLGVGLRLAWRRAQRATGFTCLAFAGLLAANQWGGLWFNTILCRTPS